MSASFKRVGALSTEEKETKLLEGDSWCKTAEEAAVHELTIIIKKKKNGIQTKIKSGAKTIIKQN
jgi:hypothetical protein